MDALASQFDGKSPADRKATLTNLFIKNPVGTQARNDAAQASRAKPAQSTVLAPKPNDFLSKTRPLTGKKPAQNSVYKAQPKSAYQPLSQTIAPYAKENATIATSAAQKRTSYLNAQNKIKSDSQVPQRPNINRLQGATKKMMYINKLGGTFTASPQKKPINFHPQQRDSAASAKNKFVSAAIAARQRPLADQNALSVTGVNVSAT